MQKNLLSTPHTSQALSLNREFQKVCSIPSELMLLVNTQIITPILVRLHTVQGDVKLIRKITRL